MHESFLSPLLPSFTRLSNIYELPNNDPDLEQSNPSSHTSEDHFLNVYADYPKCLESI